MMRQLLAGMLMLSCAVQFAFAALDINTATADEFDKLKGIGPVKAKAIVDYRVKNGPFRTVEDIKNVPGIGDSTFDAIKREIRVGAGSGLRASKPAADGMRRPEQSSAGAPSMAKGDDRPGKSDGVNPVNREAGKSDSGKPKAEAKSDSKGRSAEAPKAGPGAAKSERAEAKTGDRPSEKK